MLEHRARVTGEAAAFRFEGETRTYGRVWREVGRFARRLAAVGIGRGDRVVLALPNGPDFFTVFYGIQRAGATAVPVFPASGADRVIDLARMAGAGAIVVADGLGAEAMTGFRQAESAQPLSVLTPAGGGDRAGDAALPEVGPQDVAYVQYTSGSTGNPKGVQLCHDDLLTNVRQMIAGMEITADDVFVSWLPVHHDMGLVLMTMAPFYLAARLVLLPTSLRNVRRWLEAIERHRGTFTAAPDFAYRLALRAVGGRPAPDLSSLRVALNAAEPVRARTVATFERAFGLRRVMMPGYGLAEATVGVSMCSPGTEVKVDGRGFVSVGRPFPRVEVSVLGDRGPAEPGEVGEVLVRSPANTRGYLDNPEATAELFWKRGFLRTGDLGYLDRDGELFIVGRLKNIIIQAGRNLAPREIEETVDALPTVRLAAAVGVDRGGEQGEQAYVFAEVRRGDGLPAAERERLAIGIVQRIHRRLGFRPGRVYLLRPRTIPLTHNGKVRHLALKESYLDGSLRADGGILFPGY